MKNYCAVIEYYFSDDTNDTKVVYVGENLFEAVKAIKLDYKENWDKEACYIHAWEDGVYLETLDGNGKEWDWEN